MTDDKPVWCTNQHSITLPPLDNIGKKTYVSCKQPASTAQPARALTTTCGICPIKDGKQHLLSKDPTKNTDGLNINATI
jgi:hypothetical protein